MAGRWFGRFLVLVLSEAVLVLSEAALCVTNIEYE